MGTIFQKEEHEKVSVIELIDYVSQRIEALSAKLSSNGLSGEFAGVSSRAGAAATCDFGIAGGMFMDTLILDAVMGSIDIPMMDGIAGNDNAISNTFNDVVIVGGEVASILSDGRVSAHRKKFASAVYPEGRRATKCALDKKLQKRFNAKSAAYSFAGNDEAELMRLLELADKLETLLANKQTNIMVEAKQDITDGIDYAAKPKSVRSSMFGQNFKMAV